MIPYGRQSVDDSDIQAVSAALRSGWLTCGPMVERFESSIRDVCGAPHAVAVTNGTAALRLLYQAAGIGPGVRVGVPAITFVATATQARMLGAEVVLLDVDPETLLLQPDTVRDCPYDLDWVVPVHVAGRLCDMPAIAAAATERGIRVLEDAAHAFGSTTDDSAAGDCRFSEGAIFSFHPVKNIACAEGGAIAVRDPEWDAALRRLRHHGIVREGFRGPLAERDGDAPWYHEFHQPATNERLSDLHAALGWSQCRRLDTFKQRRAAIVARYRAACADLPHVTITAPPTDQAPFWHLCVARCDWNTLKVDRATALAQAREQGIALQIHYIPLHRQPVLADAPCWPDVLAGAVDAYEHIISLPCFPELGDDEQDIVVSWLESLARHVP